MGSFSEYFKVDLEHKNHVRLCKKNSTYHHREYNIPRVQSADNSQRDITLRLGLYSNRFYPAPIFQSAVSLARLVKAEIVSPYHGILINAGMGNPTVPLAQSLGK